MPDFRRMGEYSLRKVGEGAESEVFGVRNKAQGEKVEKGLVLKNMAGVGEDLSWHPDQATWKIDEHGFDDNYKRLFAEHRQKLASEYGDIIAQSRFIQNPDHPDHHLIAQERIDLADPAGVDEYYPVDVEDEALQQKLTEFVEKVKKNMTASLANQPAIIPDLANHNLVFNRDLTRIAYIDSGLHESVNIKDDTVLHVARLAMLGGASVEVIKQDSFYMKSLARFPELADIDDVHDFYSALLDAEKRAEDEDMNEVHV